MSFAPDDNLAYTIAGIGRKKDPYSERRTMAQRLLAQGMDTSPVQSPWQGAARLAQALMGGYDSYATDRDEKKATEDRNTKLTAAMSEADPTKRIGLISALDPELGIRLSGQMAIEQAKTAQQREGLGQVASTYGGGGGGGVQSGPLAPPGGTGNAGQAIAGIESQGGPNGGYGAVGPPANSKGNRAYGKYQVLDSNIPAWTQEVLGKPMSPQEFLASPQAQEAVFQAKFGQYVQKYGSPEAASRAWFAGEGGMNNPGAADVNGMTVQGYGNKFAQAYGPGAGGPQPPAAPPVNVRATPPGQPQPLQVNMPGPGPQGSAETNGMPPTPTPQGVQGPTMSAPPVPPQRMTVRDMPQQMAAPYIDRLRRGGYGTNPAQAEQAMVADMQRALDVSFENQKLEYERLRGDYEYGRTRSDKGADRQQDQAAKAPQQQFDNSNKLRDEFNGSTVVKNYREVTPIMESMKDAVQRPSRAADLNMVYALAKIMDPGSVVREGEMIMVNNTQGIGDRLAGMINSLNGGAQLTPETRQRIIEEAQSRYGGLESSYKALEDHYGGMSDRFGLRREDVIVPIRKPAAEGGGAKAGGGQRQRISLDGKPL
jgi:hypothetical protein